MIHYHGTPLGNKRDDIARFFPCRHAFIPFPRPEDLPTVAEVARSFAFDNGAFSAWRADWAIIPDVIDGDEQANNDLLAEWPFEECGVPVWHLHESLERLEHLAVTFPRVAFGSSGEFADIGTQEWLERMDAAMRVCCYEDGRPMTKFHGLRMLDPAVFSQYPFASADSTNVARNASRKAEEVGCNIPTARVILADRIEKHNSPATYNYRPQQRRLAFVLGDEA